MPSTDTKSTFSADMVALATKAGGMSDGELTEKVLAEISAAGQKVNATQREKAIRAVMSARTAKTTEKSLAIVDAIDAIVSAGETRKADIDPDIGRAYAIAAFLAAADKVNVDASDNCTRMVDALLAQKPAGRDDTYRAAIASATEKLEKLATTGRTSYPGRSLANVPDGTVLFYKNGKVTVRDGQLFVGKKAFTTPTPAAKAAAGDNVSVDGWSKLKTADGVTLHDLGMPKS